MTRLSLRMRRNCNLELRLSPSSVSFPSIESSPPDDHQNNRMEESVNGSPQNQQLTIFYNGRICVCDVTELQARAILIHASREMEERLRTPAGSEPTSPVIQSQLGSPNTGLSMKRSLQRFLQKRKHRVQATSPYN